MDSATMIPLVRVQTVLTELLTDDQLVEAADTLRELDGSEGERKLYANTADALEEYGRQRAVEADGV